MNLKQLLCKHKYEYLEKPKELKKPYVMAKVYCIKCEKTDYKKVNKWKMNSTNYCWCPKCSNDLVRDSFVKEDKYGIVTYKCTKCRTISKWHFAIAPIPILLED